MPQVVLVEPQIPPNTGNIARTCAATNTELHLVGPLGFEISDRYLKRAGLDYWPHVKLHVHESMAEFEQHSRSRGGRWIGFTKLGSSNYTKLSYRPDDWLLFGRETTGLSQDILAACQETARIPMVNPGVRSLNLSVSVSIGLFEARRQLGYLEE